jgi:hypothetical protein
MKTVCKCHICRSNAVRVETKESPYGAAVENFRCITCYAVTVRMAARVSVYSLPILNAPYLGPRPVRGAR